MKQYFNGEILITDPCYIIPDSKDDDWDKSNYGEDLSVLGINNYLSRSTIYGDWGCTTYRTTDLNVREHVNKIMKSDFITIPDEDNYQGKFCADAGMVAVLDMAEVDKYNPDFRNWIKEHDWCGTIIKDCDGYIEIYEGSYKDVHVIGEGNINFYTLQTGL